MDGQRSTRESEDVGDVILKNVSVLRALVDAAFDRVDVALLLRELKTLWPLCRDVALVEELVGASDETSQAQVRAKYAAFTDFVASHGLDGVWDLKPLLNVRLPAMICVYERAIGLTHDGCCAGQGAHDGARREARASDEAAAPRDPPVAARESRAHARRVPRALSKAHVASDRPQHELLMT